MHGKDLVIISQKYGKSQGQIHHIPAIVTGRNEVVAKVMFLQVCVILFTGTVCLRQTPLGGDPPGQTPPGADIPPQVRHTSPGQTPRQQTPPRSDPHPPRSDPHPPRSDPPPPTEQTHSGSRLRHTVNERPVRILLTGMHSCFLSD